MRTCLAKIESEKYCLVRNAEFLTKPTHNGHLHTALSSYFRSKHTIPIWNMTPQNVDTYAKGDPDWCDMRSEIPHTKKKKPKKEIWYDIRSGLLPSAYMNMLQRKFLRPETTQVLRRHRFRRSRYQLIMVIGKHSLCLIWHYLRAPRALCASINLE